MDQEGVALHRGSRSVRSRRAVLAIVGLVLLVGGIGAGAPFLSRWVGGGQLDPLLTTPTPSPSPVVAAAGDIACDPRDPAFLDGKGTARACRMRATSDLLISDRPDVVLALGDLQYGSRGMADLRASYDPTWGRVRAITSPIAGDNEYESAPGASAYFGYFGARAGRPGQGWYSFDLGSWH